DRIGYFPAAFAGPARFAPKPQSSNDFGWLCASLSAFCHRKARAKKGRDVSQVSAVGVRGFRTEALARGVCTFARPLRGGRTACSRPGRRGANPIPPPPKASDS